MQPTSTENNVNTNPPKRSKRKWLIAAAAIALIILIIVFSGSSKETPKEEEKIVAALTVSSAAATHAQWAKTLIASGAVAAWQEAIIGSEISGQRLIEVAVNVGDEVKKGQVLARFNPDTIKAEQAELYAQWQQAEADSKRAVSLKDSGAMSAQQIETYKSSAAVAKARYEAKALQLKYATVIAPDDGVISARNATLGGIANAGSELFRMIIQGRLEWRGELTAEQLVNVKEGQVVVLKLPDGSASEATIRQISPILSAQRMATVYADIKTGSHAYAGMYANGSIELKKSQAIIVPAASVVIRDGHSYVFKLADKNAETKVILQEVKTGRDQDNFTEIVSGLNEGDFVAVKGAGFLNNDDTVRVSNEISNEAK